MQWLRNNNIHYTLLVLGLLIVGISIFIYKAGYLGYPLSPKPSATNWLVEASVQFNTKNNSPIKVQLAIPNELIGFSQREETFTGFNYGFTSKVENNNRYVTWAKRRGKGKQTLYYRAIYTKNTNQKFLPKITVTKPPISEKKQAAMKTFLEMIRSHSADIETFAMETVKLANNSDLPVVKELIGKKPSKQKVNQLILDTLALANIEAISVQGLDLDKSNETNLETWILIKDDTKLFFINPETGKANISKNFLIWHYGNTPILKIKGGNNKSLTFLISNYSTRGIASTLNASNPIISQFNLHQLPLQLQNLYKVMLIIPLGVLIILLFRNIIGMPTFGTFMPVLIALSFLETKLLVGISLFILLVCAGLLLRFYLNQMRLLMIPRLGFILTFVILCMLFISIISQKVGYQIGVTIALFPMVIITMTIERMCILWEELGANQAIKIGLSSLLASILAYSFMSMAELQYLFFTFPELILVLLALFLLLGNYRGYRLSELSRFKVLAKEK